VIVADGDGGGTVVTLSLPILSPTGPESSLADPFSATSG
jgi:hypothetical protein